MNFAGIEMDVVIGHPEHELLFVGAQVAKSAGLKPQAVQNVHRGFKEDKGLTISDLLKTSSQSDRVSLVKSLVDPLGRRLHSAVWLLDETTVYQMLLRGRAPQSEPFRKWVTEEVLPSIRKTGQYDITKSTTPEAMRK